RRAGRLLGDPVVADGALLHVDRLCRRRTERARLRRLRPLLRDGGQRPEAPGCLQGHRDLRALGGRTALGGYGPDGRLRPELRKAGVDLFGVANMTTFLQSTSGVIREIFKLEFGDLDRDAAFLKTISPIEEVDKIRDPLFV